MFSPTFNNYSDDIYNSPLKTFVYILEYLIIIQF